MKQFYTCDHCRQVIMFLNHEEGGQNQHFKPLPIYHEEKAGEKHKPVVTVSGNEVYVNVGQIYHPMSDEHLIEWIFLETKQGGQIKYLSAEQMPEATFELIDDTVIGVYAYCNQHGLWYQKI